MALTKDKKHEVVAETSDLLNTSKLTVVAQYDGTTVKQLQELRKQAREGKTQVKIIKNRLVIKALQQNDTLKNVDTSALTAQLLYAFNAEDEVAPAQILANFSKKNPSLRFVGAITPEGVFMSIEDVKSLASLPSKNVLIASVIGTLESPMNDVLGGLSGGLSGIISGLEAKAV